MSINTYTVILPCRPPPVRHSSPSTRVHTVTSLANELDSAVSGGSLGTAVAAQVLAADNTLTVTLDAAKFVQPATFVPSGCTGKYANDAAANKFTADCSPATTGGDSCTLTRTAGYKGGK